MRDYNPLLGRYVEADPIGQNGGLNVFNYVENDSINWIDPLGYVRARWRFDKWDHSRNNDLPHFTDETTGYRYKAADLTPQKHLTMPPPLTKSQLKSLTESPAWKEWLKFQKMRANAGTCTMRGRLPKGLNTLGIILQIVPMLFDDTEKRATEHGINVLDQMIGDIYEGAGYSVVYPKEMI